MVKQLFIQKFEGEFFCRKPHTEHRINSVSYRECDSPSSLSRSVANSVTLVIDAFVTSLIEHSADI